MSVRSASPAQQRFWLLEQLSGSGTSQNVCVCVRIDGRLDLDRLRSALRTVIARHEVLRSTYRWESDRLVADLLPVDAIEMHKTGSLTAHSHGAHAVERMARELAEAPFDLARGPLLRAVFVANGPEQSYMFLAVHHIVWDGWSFGVLLAELSAAYEGDDGQLSALDRQYWDYAEQRIRDASGDRGERDLGYWRTQLDGLHQLPPLTRAASTETPEIHRWSTPVAPDLAAEVARFARAHNLTPFCVFVAALQACLYRLGFGQHSAFGVPLADRPESAFERLVGCFLNTTVLRGVVSDEDTLERLASRVLETTLESLEHCSLPFEVIAQRLAPGRNLSKDPLFQSLFVFQNSPQERLTIDGIEAETVNVLPSRGEIDPTFTVSLHEPEPTIAIEWNGTLLVPAGHLLGSWTSQLWEGLREPHASIAQRRHEGATTPATPKSVAQLLQERSQREPEALALVSDGRELTLGDVVQQSAAVAARLRRAGIETGTAVGLAAGRSPRTVVATLAILMAGGVCVPLDPDHPADRLRFQISDSDVALVLADAVDDTWMDAPSLTLEGEGLAGARPTARRFEDGTAWVLYTSGSTGMPKGALISHGMVVARLLREPIPWEPGERGCHKTSLSFIDSIWEMFAPLAHGLPTAIADPPTARDPRLLARLLERDGVTRIVLVPSLLAALLSLEPHDLARLNGVKLWISTGEALPASLAERFYRLLPGASLVNLYGTSECWDVTWHRVPPSARAGEVMPIGQPLADVRVWLLDDGFNPVPTDVPAEIFVGGPCVSKGYLNRPELAAGRFLPATLLVAGDEGTVYRTGDIGVQRSDGALEILGRRDLQVKLRGFRVELEEVERALRATPTVAESAVVARRDADGSVAGLTAFVVLDTGVPLDVAALRQELGERLPDQSVPSEFVKLAAMPLTVNGKVDRAELAARATDRVMGATEVEHQNRGPTTAGERAIARIWCEVLDLKRVSVTDDFFQLGGHSVTAVHLALRIYDEFAVEVPLLAIYANPTVSGLSELVSDARDAGKDERSL